ncbi:extracellular exo-alpha-L-arabinofuranosidase [Abditibacteriota bacterium]|nr:extracellular exo-alpha-L-arabinofuranosidase [Abditibacteriota bacterium]
MKKFHSAFFVMAASAVVLCSLRADVVTPDPLTPNPTTKGPMSYTLRPDTNPANAEKLARVVQAMNEAIGLYNAMGEFPKAVSAGYNSGTPTADGNYNGTIRFGGQIGTRVALHELGHVLGVGTHPRWGEFVKEGKWTGPYAVAQLRAFDGPDVVLHADRMHFWPYGLNFDTEDGAENRRRHVLMVAAFRRDLGIKSGQPFRGLVGVGTWKTQAEFKDFKVVKNGQTLWNGDLSKGLEGWKTMRGQWAVKDGVLSQTGTDEDVRALWGDPSWTDYTFTVKARKTGGDEGFLISFGVPNDDTKSWWNIGGWGNTQHLLEAPDIVSEPVDGKVETGRWYDVRVEVKGATVRCFLDGQLVSQGTR